MNVRPRRWFRRPRRLNGAVPSPPRPPTLEAAWSDLHDAKPDGWYVGRPHLHEGRGVWEQYAFDPLEQAQVGVRSREWTAVAQSEIEVVRELARCLRLIRDGRVPE